jgi:citrate synthase
MKAFWRKNKEDLEMTPEHYELLEQLFAAHHRSCFRDNPSSVAVMLSAHASGDLAKAISCAIATMGARHAPVEATVQFLSLENPELEVASILKRGRKVPGWGGTFQKDLPDPLWAKVNELIPEPLQDKLAAVTAMLHQYGKLIWPNPSAYTACVAIVLGMPPKLAPYLFIHGRLTGWAQIADRYLGE